jgi:hypothetical protein
MFRTYLPRPLYVALAIAACGETTHVYSGRLYVEDRDCVATTSSIEVVEGDPAPDTCAPACLVQRTTPDGTRPVYVSKMCPPVPFGFDTDAKDPRCAPALAAFERNDTCFTDGGSSAPADAGRD